MNLRHLQFALPLAGLTVGCVGVIGAFLTVAPGDWTSLGLSALTTLRSVKTIVGA
jgi:hypothetical protein